MDNLNNWEADRWNKSEQVLAYIALKGCAWPTDLARNLLMKIEDINQILGELVHRKDIVRILPFERFSPPEIVMTRASDLTIEASNSMTPENWAKKSFFRLTEEGFHKWRERHKGEHLRAHRVYISLFDLSLNSEQ